MLRMRKSRSSMSIGILGFLLACIVGTTIHYGSFGEASTIWSYLSGSSDTAVEDDESPVLDLEMDELVSPIVNREIKVSVEV